MSRGDLGGGSFEFRGDDADFQKTAGRVEARMTEAAENMRRAAAKIDLSLAQNKISVGGLETEIEKSMAKAASNLRKEAGTIERALKDLGTTEEETKNLFKGFGQLTILSYISAGLKKMGDEAAIMATKVRLGEVSTDDLIIKVAEGIPIIGKFVEAGRGIREAITGEKAYTEVIKQQTEQQERRIAQVKDYLDTLKEIRRLSEDLARLLSQHGPPGLGFDISSALVKGSREAEDLTKKIIEQRKKSLDEIDKQRLEFGQKIINLQSRNVITESSGLPVAQRDQKDIDRDIRSAQRTLADLDKEAQTLRDSLKILEDQSREKIGRGVATEVFGLFGAQAKRAFEIAKSAADFYVQNLPRLSSETAHQLESMRGDWEKFQNDLIRIKAELNQGLITPKDFGKLTEKSFWDNAKKSLEDYFSQAKARFETLGIIIDSNLGSPLDFVKRAIAGTANLFSSLANPKAKELPQFRLPDFRAQFVGLSALNEKIQAAAGSDNKEERRFREQMRADKENANAVKTAVNEAKDAIKGLVTLGTVS